MEKSRKKKIFLRIFYSILILFGIFAVFSVLYINYAPGTDMSNFENEAKNQDRTTKLYYIDNQSGKGAVAKELDGEELFLKENREWIKYENIPKNLVNAFVAIEDHRFFEHKGIDIRRTGGAIYGYLTGKSSYGGSTITQQLIKNVTGDNSYSVKRKIREIIRAYKLEKILSKEEILELYLNTIYLSEQSYGVGSAAENYFGKELYELSLAECASIAAITQSPSRWNPRRSPENNESRRKIVLKRMLETGKITESEYNSAIKEEIIVTEKEIERSKGKIYSWYTEAVIDECLKLFTEKGLAKNEDEGIKLLYTGGFKIITAENPIMQEKVEEYFADTRNFYSTHEKNHPECSCVVINHKNGNILALAGATGVKSINRGLNYATENLRSPGSSIKPLSVYAPGIENKVITYGSVIDDTPCDFIYAGKNSLRPWPRNYPEGYRGLTTIRDAVSRSVNTVAVKVLEKVGKETSFNLLHDKLKMENLVSGVNRNGKNYTDKALSPLALGQLTNGVTVKEITSAYTALCNEGKFSYGKCVLKIIDRNGNIIIDNENESEEVFSPETASIMTKLLQGVTSSGTGSAVNIKKSYECAGKTGTTNNDCDRWFIGYTPDLLAGVWFGKPHPESLDGYPTVPGPALKTWDNIMTMLNTYECLGVTPKRSFDVADGVITAKYCRDSGMLIQEACCHDPRGSRAEIGYFTKDTVPVNYCTCHVFAEYDKVNGGIASPECKPENIVRVGLLNVLRDFPHNVIISDAQYTYRRLPYGVPPCLDATEPFYLYMIKKGRYCGNSAVKFPFNRYCTGCKAEEKENEGDNSFDDEEFEG